MAEAGHKYTTDLAWKKKKKFKSRFHFYVVLMLMQFQFDFNFDFELPTSLRQAIKRNSPIS